MNANSLPGFSSPNASTEAPLEMLAACHGRVEKQCETLQRLAAHLPAHGADRAAQEAATAVMRYFDTAARHHHADEEHNLFPALLEAMSGSDALCIRDLTEHLSAQHRVLEALWAGLRPQLDRITQGAHPETCSQNLIDFAEAYLQHVAQEDRDLLPMAQRLLDDAALRQIGAAMRERRGIPPV